VSRLESQARAGVWPTPPRVVDAIAGHLAAAPRAGKRVVRLLDPCAGTGAAVAHLGRALGAETFGIELSAERAVEAREVLDHLLATSAFSVRLANGAFSCLFLNPPYDHDDEKRRLEHAFLVGLTRALCSGGVLAFIVPQVRLAVSARYLAAHYTNFVAYRFPDPEHAAFGQIVLLASRKAQAVADPAAQAELEAWAGAPLPVLPDHPERPLLTVPALPSGEVLFAPLGFEPRLAAAEARRRGVWAQPAFVEQVWPTEERAVRPLMPLRRGHLALLIAAGLLNNVVLERSDRRVLVKGRIRKDLVQAESDDETTEIQREVLRISVVSLDLVTGRFQVLDQGGAAASRSGPGE
jgi:hypothetical protein